MDLTKFNESQRKAITHYKGPALVLAGPGSGKTTVLTNRIAYLVKEKNIQPDKILVVTFTKSAAEEMKNRFIKMVNDGQGVRFGTFHSVFYSILRTYYKDLKIIDTKQMSSNLKTALKSLGLDPLRFEAYEQELSYIKNRGDITKDYKPAHEDINHDDVIRLIESLRKICLNSGQINFDDMAYETYRLFRDNPTILETWRKKYSYFLLDEFQDICPIQYSLVRDMCQLEHNLFVVGDDDQSIYGFRGAGTEIMLGFPKDYPEAVCINLNLNYRCRPEIIHSACKVIKENKKRFSKIQEPVRQSGKLVEINPFVNEKLESEWLIDKLLKLKGQGRLDDVAILFRKHGDYDKVLSRIKRLGIPYRLNYEAKSMKDTFIFNDIWNYLLFLEGCNSRDVFFEVMNKPNRGISRQTCMAKEIKLDQLCHFYNYDKKISDELTKLYHARNFTKSISLYGKINFVRKGLGYDDYLLKEASHNSIEANNFIAIIDEIHKISLDFKTSEQWFKHISNQNNDMNTKTKHEGVNIMTYHASKGLEFDIVLLPGVNEGNVPYNKAVRQDEIEEERRMFYVAMTRAKDELYISYLSGTIDQPEKPSRFLKPLGV